MFQLELVRALQSLESAPLTALMVAVTYLGYGTSFFVLTIGVLFAVDFRKGVVLAQVLVWSALVLYAVKHGVALPRPVAVDPSLGMLDPGVAVSPGDAVAVGFWDGLPGEVVARHRALADPSHGFPSGHVAVTLACWGTLALLFRRRWLAWLAGGLVVLMSFSRMYLGQHFLADVVGGIVLGALVLAAVAALWRQRARMASFARRTAWRPFVWGAGLVLPFALLLIPVVRPEDVARLVGLNLGLALVASGGWPRWTGGVVRRAVAVAGALAMYALLGMAWSRVGPGASDAWAFAGEVVAMAAMLRGGVALDGVVGRLLGGPGTGSSFP